MFHNSSWRARVGYSVGPAKVKYLATENAMAFGFELKLYRLLQKYLPFGVTKVFSLKSVSCSKTVKVSTFIKKGF